MVILLLKISRGFSLHQSIDFGLFVAGFNKKNYDSHNKYNVILFLPFWYYILNLKDSFIIFRKNLPLKWDVLYQIS